MNVELQSQHLHDQAVSAYPQLGHLGGCVYLCIPVGTIKLVGH